MFSSVPRGKPSLRAAYQAWCQAYTPLDSVFPKKEAVDPTQLNVGIIGGGMSGLYAGLLLREFSARYHIFEASSRLGGRVYTHRFNEQPNQYFEAGAMRLPDIPEQQPVFDLIDYLNEQIPATARIETIPYVLEDESGNLVLVNGRRRPDGQAMSLSYANAHPAELGFPLSEPDRSKTAQALLDEVIGPILKLLEQDFEKGFQEIVKYDDYSMRSFLAQVAKWSEAKINYVEVMTSQTNQFQNSFTELVIENMDFSTAQWKTIKDGMCRLPEACGIVLGADNITMNAEITEIDSLTDGRVAVYHSQSATPAVFDQVLVALPPASLRMLDTPQWSVAKEEAIRALHFEPLYKIGLRFKTRFWERVRVPSRGGQSITDLPSRWCVYPSYGIGNDGPGVLLLYSWMTDAVRWLPMSTEDKVRIALRDLASVYAPEVDVQAQFVEAFDVAWPIKWATGDAMFFPGQFKNLFNVARQPAGNIYFAGEHLSVHHTWIVGALDSALNAFMQMLGSSKVRPLRAGGRPAPEPHDYDYSKIAASARRAASR